MVIIYKDEILRINVNYILKLINKISSLPPEKLIILNSYLDKLVETLSFFNIIIKQV